MTRSNSNSSTITLNDIKTLIDNAKTEIITIMKKENDKILGLVNSLQKRVEGLEQKNSQLEHNLPTGGQK